MAFAELLDQVGSLGRFQILHTVFLCITIVIACPHFILENFTAAIPDHRCWVHLLDNDTTSADATGTLSQEDLLRVSIPLDSSLRPEKCRRFVHPQWQLLHQNGSFPDVAELDTEPCVDGWVYDHSTFSSTIVTEWDLVCESRSLKFVVQSVLMVGAMLGSPFYGYISDRFGRKLGIRASLLQLAITSTAVAFAPTFLVYSSLRFLEGFCILSILLSSCVFMVEWVSPHSRALVLMLLVNSCSVGQILLGGLAYIIHDWCTLQLTFSAPLFVNFLISRKLGESAQWLIVTSQIDEGLKELQKAAHINGKHNTEDSLTIEHVKSVMQKDLDTTHIKVSVLDLFRTPKIRARTCCTIFVRFATGLALYGLVFNVQHFGSNIFLSQILFAAVTLGSRCFLLPALNHHMSRRTSQLLFLFLEGISLLTIAFLSKELQSVRITLAAIGISSASTVSVLSALHHNEFMPTILRMTSGGLQTLITRIGAAMAPPLMLLDVYLPQLPWIIYGVFSILAGLTIQALPETKDQPLPSTIQDVENNTRESRKIKPENTCMKITQF